MPHCLTFRNVLSRGSVSKFTNDENQRSFYYRSMASDRPPVPNHDWFLRQWLDTLDKSQADLERLTGWDKRKASHLVNGKQPYKRDTVNEASKALNIAPFELLMHPDDAFALHRLREDVIRIAAETKTPFSPMPSDISHRRQAG